MNKKGFTLIELISVILILSILLSVATYSLYNYLKQGREKSYNLLINSFEDGVLEAYTSCLVNPTATEFCLNHDIPSYNGTDTVKLSELLNDGFVEKMKNPWNTNQECDKDSYVTVKRDDRDNISFTYKTCLICGNKKSDGC